MRECGRARDLGGRRVCGVPYGAAEWADGSLRERWAGQCLRSRPEFCGGQVFGGGAGQARGLRSGRAHLAAQAGRYLGVGRLCGAGGRAPRGRAARGLGSGRAPFGEQAPRGLAGEGLGSGRAGALSGADGQVLKVRALLAAQAGGVLRGQVGEGLPWG